jgi:hypothetical protein
MQFSVLGSWAELGSRDLESLGLVLLLAVPTLHIENYEYCYHLFREIRGRVKK